VRAETGTVTQRPDRAAPWSRDRLVLAAATERLAWLAFGALVIVSPLRAHVVIAERPLPPVYEAYTDIVLAWSEIALAAVVVLWLIGRWLRPRPFEFGPMALAIPLGALLGLAWLSSAFSPDPALAASKALGLTLAGGLALYVVNEVGRPARMVPLIAVAIVVQGVLALAQVAGQSSIGLAVLGEHAVTPATAGASVVAAADSTRLLRGYGLADHPNVLGGILAAGGLLVAVAPGRLRAPASTVMAAALVVTALALFVTFSRSAWLASGVGLVVAVAMLVRAHEGATLRRLGLVGAVAVAGVIAIAVPFAPYLATRLEPGRDDVALEARSVDERAALAAATARVVAGNPLTGVGPGVLPTALRTSEPVFAFSYQPAHLVPLTVAAEVGLAGAVAWLGAALAPWLLAWRARRSWTRELAATTGALAALTVVSLFDYYPWTFPAGRIWWWMAIALWIVAWRRAVAGSANRDIPGVPDRTVA